MSKKIMILGASILQLPAIQKAKDMGLEVIVVDMNPKAIGFDVEGVIKEIISTIDIEAVLSCAKRHNIDGIMTLASDMPMKTVAKVAQELNLIGISEDTAMKATNKALMRDALKEKNVPVPMYYRVSSKKEFIDAVKRIKDDGYKCIVKPVDNSGSRGIDLLRNYQEDTLNKAFEYSKKSSRSGDLMVEEYMEGPEVSVETLCVEGICYVIQITDKVTTGSPYFVEMGHSQPSQLDSEIQKKIKCIAIEANCAIGIKNGPSHTEIKVTKDGPKIVEIGARLGGDNITTHLVPLSTGVDMVEACIKLALGEKPHIEAKYCRGAAIRYFHQKKGIIRTINGLENAKLLDGIRQIGLVHGLHEEVTDVVDSNSRIGFVIAQNKNAEKAIQDCEEALRKIEIVIE